MFSHCEYVIFVYSTFSNNIVRALCGVLFITGTAVAQWLRCCVTIPKVAGSIPAGASGFFVDIKSF